MFAIKLSIPLPKYIPSHISMLAVTATVILIIVIIQSMEVVLPPLQPGPLAVPWSQDLVLEKFIRTLRKLVVLCSVRQNRRAQRCCLAAAVVS